MSDTKKHGENPIENFIPQLKTFIESETVFGKPYEVDGITLIPVQNVRVGFAMGSKEKATDSKASQGGSGGISLSPVAMLIIRDGYVSVQSLNASNIEGLLDKIPDFLEKTYEFSQKVFQKKEKTDS